MKMAISIDDSLLQAADETARTMGLSRSRLFALAVDEFLQRQRLANGLEPAEELLLNGIKLKFRATLKDHW